MAITILQKPKYKLIPASSKIIFTLTDNVVLANKKKIKFVAEVYVSNKSGNISNIIENRVAVLKTTPNGEGSAIFDLSPILQSHVSPDYDGGTVHNTNTNFHSQYNGTDYSDTTPHTIHQIDDFSTNRNSVRFFKVMFNVEAAASLTGSVTQQYNTDTPSDVFLIYNGVLYDTDTIKMDVNGNFGYHLGHQNLIMNSSGDKFFTNAPTTQYVRTADYLTLPFISQYNDDFRVGVSGITNPSIRYIKIQFYYNGSTTGSLITKEIQASTGGHSGYMSDSNVKLQFAGVGTGNLVGSGVSLPANWDYYTVVAHDYGDNLVSDTYYIYKQDEDCKGYETIRLTWLNKFGTWDYYNFTKKSTRTFNATRKTYSQITGSWNKSKYILNGHSGGSKSFNNTIKESIVLNTDFITEAQSEWLEELFISNDVYILKQRSTDNTNEGYIRKYLEPVTLTSNSYTRKTQANDRLIQHTLNIQTTRTKKSQRV